MDRPMTERMTVGRVEFSEDRPVYYELRRKHSGGGHRFEGTHDCFVADCAGLARDLEQARIMLAIEREKTDICEMCEMCEFPRMDHSKEFPYPGTADPTCAGFME